MDMPHLYKMHYLQQNKNYHKYYQSPCILQGGGKYVMHQIIYDTVDQFLDDIK